MNASCTKFLIFTIFPSIITVETKETSARMQMRSIPNHLFSIMKAIPFAVFLSLPAALLKIENN